MLFPTISFAVFFSITICLYWACIHGSRLLGSSLANQLRKIVLLLASYVFYGIWDWHFLPLLLGSSSLNYLFARILLRIYRGVSPAQSADLSQQSLRPQKWARLLLGLAIGLNLASLIFFKYSNWLLINLNTLFHAAGLPLLLSKTTFILPLGISFFTFQNISFLIDIYRRKLQRSGSYADYSLYIAFFPQLIAGPIVRANNILPQLQRLPDARNIYLSDAFSRISIGLIKKLFIANTLSTSFVDPVFLVPSAHSGWELLLAAYAYGAVIYCDFSAYSDMAVGLGLLCGIRLMENFDRPYACYSVQSFWRGWHISLSTWLRDYLYIPLGGNRRGHRHANIILTMLLGGFWHGASWTFLLWGALHGIIISIEHLVRSARRKKNKWEAAGELHKKLPRNLAKLKVWGGWFYSFHFVTLTWILFRAPNFDIAGQYFARLLSFANSTAGGLTHVTHIALLAILLGILPQILLPRTTALLTHLLDRLPLIVQVLLFALSLALLQVVLPDGVAPFIYYQF